MQQNIGWYFPQTGGPEVLAATELAMPEPGEHEVLIKVLASGFNPIDSKIRAGLAPIAADNKVPGCDACGDVIKVGKQVAGFAVGDRVYGCIGGVAGSSGTLCQYVAADAHLLAKAPQSISIAQAATLPLVAITAHEALQRLQLHSNDSLLIMGGSGGVGRMAIQLARLQGAQVTATAGSEARQQQLRSLGVEAYHHNDVEQLGARFNKVLDTFGGQSLLNALLAARPGGHVATINARNTYDLSQAHAKGLTLHAVFMLLPLLTGNGRADHGVFLQQLAEWVDLGLVSAAEAEEAPAADVAAVHERYEAGELKHKVAFVLP
ncbi:quinone oxidoreductase [Bacterioplanes sanyensis]|uniref:Quinone oxidoreductase n=1 Tax=Bacterioplanes sanyensis TaxID=1249553 RepID=A0A222FNE9_9GAMM|nr:zinc-binding dehydrogenase [Bacterioplanes sanyensis]ASP40548.1 quinone oxidoreductase [Bacterioplanes sanyensis]